MLLISLGAIELTQVLLDKKLTQDTADAAALMGAGQLGVSPAGVNQRAQNFALSELWNVANHAAVTASAVVNGDGSFTVSVDTQRASFFGSLLPPGGFHTHVEATAKGANSTPICVLALNSAGLPPTSSDAATLLHVAQSSTLSAPACLVHSNLGITVDAGQAGLTASSVEAVAMATGAISPSPLQSAPPISDPFSSLNVEPPTSCASANPQNVNASQSQTLPAGMHGALSASGSAVITLAPGEHYFCSAVNMNDQSVLTGTDVVLVFDNNATLNLGGSSLANLSGRQSGPLAGFVLVTDREYSGTFTLQSDPISTLTGTVYLPNAALDVQGSSTGGAASPWTVVAAQALELEGSAQLVINANYAGSSVPVPAGVGNRRSGVAVELTQ